MIIIAAVGWWLVRRHRRTDHGREDQHRRVDHQRQDHQRHQDHQRTDLATPRQLLEDADLQVRRVTRLERVAGREDFALLQNLQDRAERVAERGPAGLRAPFDDVAKLMEAYIKTAVPDAGEAMEIYCKASQPDDVPASWELTVLLKQAERQGRTAVALAHAIKVAEQAVDDLLTD
ncbi:hypothetical protein ACKI16_30850 [Streptomyces scabiei]|uniref:hypothetical protein n=1 Tax=Streptomyces scabiei TaxID=1930 RepID=UPI0038F6F752